MSDTERLQERIDSALEELDKLADLLADSEELLVKQTPAVSRLNDIIAALAGLEAEPGPAESQ